MKRPVFILILLVFTMPVFAEFSISLNSGYTSVMMDNLNDNIDRIFEDAMQNPQILYLSKNYVTQGWYIGLDAGYSFLPFLSAGLRLQYISTFNAQMKARSDGQITNITDATADLNASLIPILAGLSYSYKMPSMPLSCTAGIYCGYGFAKLSVNTLSQYEYFTLNTTEEFSGGCFVLDTDLNIRFSVNNIFSVSLTTGYRNAKSTYLSYTKIGVSPAAASKYNKDLQLDFTGIRFGLGIDFTL